MELHAYIMIAMIWLLAAMTPGPNFFITVQTALSDSKTHALVNVSGIVTGTALWATLGYSGLTMLFSWVPYLYYGMKTVGGLYLIYLGFRLYRTQSTPQEPDSAPPSSNRTYFLRGFITNLLNPKTAIFITSLYAATMPAHQTFQAGLLSVLLICTISFCWYGLVAMLFSATRLKHAYVTYRHWITRVAGSILVLFGLKLTIVR